MANRSIYGGGYYNDRIGDGTAGQAATRNAPSSTTAADEITRLRGSNAALHALLEAKTMECRQLQAQVTALRAELAERPPSQST